MGLKENLKSARLSLGLTLDEAALKIGVSKPTLQRYESGVIANIPAENIEKLATLYATTPALLMGWAQNGFANDNGVSIPVLGNVAAGLPNSAFENVIGTEYISDSDAAMGEYFALRISGSSMEPKISEGDTVIVRKQSDVESGKIAIVMVGGHEATCKKLVKHMGGVSLVPLNSAYPVLFFTNEEIMNNPVSVIGQVVELRAKL